MNGQKSWSSIILGLVMFVIVLSFSIGSNSKPVEAACGASTSSCKTCHEVQGEDPVSQKGDWHTQHAFGDFCQLCHLGVSTETDKAKAHVGMVANPVTQPDQSCASCHPSDTAERVAKYGGTAASGTTSTGSETSGTGSNEASGSNTASGNDTHGVSGVSVSPAAESIPPSENPNYDVIDFNNYVAKTSSWLAWLFGILDVVVLLVLAGLFWRWKKGFWPWAYFKPQGKWINLASLPVEAQELYERLQNTEVQTILALNQIISQEKKGDALLQALTYLSEDEIQKLMAKRSEKTEVSVDHKGGKDFVH